MTMLTVNRFPRENYLFNTVLNLERSGLPRSVRLADMFLVSSLPNVGWLTSMMFSRTSWLKLCIPHEGRLPHENAGYALKLAGGRGTRWVLFLEDDIDVCDEFLDGVGLWLDRHGAPLFRIFSFGAAYEQTGEQASLNVGYWAYPVDSFYGTQCFAIRSEDALSLGDFILKYPLGKYKTGNYDLMMHDWSRVFYPEHPHFLASAPSFVQHLGRESSIEDRPVQPHFPSWPGRDWRYA